MAILKLWRVGGFLRRGRPPSSLGCCFEVKLAVSVAIESFWAGDCLVLRWLFFLVLISAVFGRLVRWVDCLFYGRPVVAAGGLGPADRSIVL